jgi:hypothetical protein
MADVEFHIDREELAAEIRAQAEEQITAGEYDPQLQAFMTDEVIPVWQANSPDDTGEYVEVKYDAQGGRGAVGTSIGYAHIVEYGSVDTPEFAPRAKTAAHFGPDSTGDFAGRRRGR